MTHRERLALDEDGKPIVLKNLPNNRLVNNLYSKMVDQKTNYSFGRPLSFDTENKNMPGPGSVFGARFLRTMHNVGEGAWIGGKSWLYPYYESGSWLSGAFLRMRSCRSGRTLTTPSWTLLSMSMWCRNTMRPNTPRMWSRWRSCTAAVWTVSSARMTACWSRTALPTPAPTSSPSRTMKPAKWRATTGSASRWCALRAPP
ncbi:MAG: phage portal protein [Evtepia gabavorous]